MTGTPHLAVQASLFGAGEPEVDHGLTGLVRHDLDERSWVDYVPGWLSGDDTLFAELERAAPWRQRQRQMWDTVVEEPRLVAVYDDLRALPPVLDEARRLLSARYEVGLDSCLVNLYRDGRDSVAWHGDRIGRSRREDTMVAILSLGETRKLMLRPASGASGQTRTVLLGHGDLVVMGGSCQRTWEHCIPKTERPCGPRISVQYRVRGVR